LKACSHTGTTIPGEQAQGFSHIDPGPAELLHFWDQTRRSSPNPADSAENRRAAELVLDGRILPADFHEPSAAEYLAAGREAFTVESGEPLDESVISARWPEL
jgi:hypothetical protein